MKYRYYQKRRGSLRRALTSVSASLVLLVNSFSVAVPFLLVKGAAAAPAVVVQPSSLNGWSATTTNATARNSRPPSTTLPRKPWRANST